MIVVSMNLVPKKAQPTTNKTKLKIMTIVPDSSGTNGAKRIATPAMPPVNISFGKRNNPTAKANITLPNNTIKRSLTNLTIV